MDCKTMQDLEQVELVWQIRCFEEKKDTYHDKGTFTSGDKDWFNYPWLDLLIPTIEQCWHGRVKGWERAAFSNPEIKKKEKWNKT